jgi:hypothetical protein
VASCDASSNGRSITSIKYIPSKQWVMAGAVVVNMGSNRVACSIQAADAVLQEDLTQSLSWSLPLPLLLPSLPPEMTCVFCPPQPLSTGDEEGHVYVYKFGNEAGDPVALCHVAHFAADDSAVE